ncbi:hypothetical protein HJC23_007881 [Cyclotella cryptica]|uniref:Uncharacterized protein n=1 Tax=Cyclotella cryptica TaxID=29204 RepID=A0ABD3REK6_9STRA
MPTRSKTAACLVSLLVILPLSSAFVPTSSHRTLIEHATTRTRMADDRKAFELMVDLPGGKDLSAKMKFMPVLDAPSEIIEQNKQLNNNNASHASHRLLYQVPFGLDVAPKNNMAVCTKAGTAGEKPGDVLRYTSQWTLGLPRGDGVITTAMSFSGGISWQCSMFDVMAAKRWEDVVAALVSNESSRTDEVVLLFERAVEGANEGQS